MSPFKKPQLREFKPVVRSKPTAIPATKLNPWPDFLQNLRDTCRMTQLPKMTEPSVCRTCGTDVAKLLEKNQSPSRTPAEADGTYPVSASVVPASDTVWDRICPVCKTGQRFKLGVILVGGAFAGLIVLGMIVGGGTSNSSPSRSSSGSSSSSGPTTSSDESRAETWCLRKWAERAATDVQNPSVSSDDLPRGYEAFTRACMKSNGY